MPKMTVKPITSKPKAQPIAKRLDQFISVFKNSAIASGTDTMRKMARDVRDEVRRAIQNQAYQWMPLSKDYAEMKRRNNLDPRIYVATGFFLNNIKYWKDSKGKWHVGLRPRVKHPDSDLTLVHLARIHEFGVDRPDKGVVIPARPVWRPAVARVLRSKGMYRRMFNRLTAKKMERGGK
jgi:phage gpG-like protein